MEIQANKEDQQKKVTIQSLFSIYILNKMGMQKRQFLYASNYHLLVCKDGKLRRKMILENNLLKFYGLGCQKCNGSLICIVWLIDENINLGERGVTSVM